MLFKKKDPITDFYDAIVIGGGLGGLTLANRLAKENKKILLLESHNKLGGFATWFKRQSPEGHLGHHIFDVSLHGFPYGMVKTCRKYWSKEIADHIVPLQSIRYINPKFSLDTTFTKEDFSRILVDDFQVDQNTVTEFFQFLAEMNFYDSHEMTNRELFQKFFPDRNDIVRFLMEPIVYANGSTLDDPAITYGIVFSNFMSKGVFVFSGGTDLMISMMKEELLKNGVDIKLQSYVEKIAVHEGAVTGVWCNGQFIGGKTVISNANLKRTALELIGKDQLSTPYVNGIESMRLNSSSVQVYIGLKKDESIPFIGDLIFTSVDETFDTDKILSPDIRSQTFSVYYPHMRNAEVSNESDQASSRYAIVSSSNARFSDWDHLNDEEYQAQKLKAVERALIELEKIIPTIREKIDIAFAATPRTILRYTHHQNGASFGTKFEGLKLSMEIKNEVKGMYHAGSVGIIMSGWLGAANYGVIVAHDVLKYLETLENLENLETSVKPHLAKDMHHGI